MKDKFIPLVTMLTAGAVSIIICLVQRREPLKSLIILLCVLVGFYIIGRIAKKLIDKVMFSVGKNDAEENTEPEEITDEETTEDDGEA